MESITEASQSCQIPADCPEYVRCNAPICPLDKDWQLRVFDTSDSTCLFLRETVKEGAEQRLAVNAVYQELHEISVKWIDAERARIAARNGPMSRGHAEHFKAVQAAAKSGSTLDKRQAAGERLAARGATS
jgi:hypothetical protein